MNQRKFKHSFRPSCQICETNFYLTQRNRSLLSDIVAAPEEYLAGVFTFRAVGQAVELIDPVKTDAT
jgi:hypothetical protein